MSVRAIDVVVQMDSEAIGSGVIEYIDDAVSSTQELYRDRCVAQVLCIDNECYDNGVTFCYTDILTKNQGGVAEITLRVPIEADGIAVGEAELPFVDAYGAVVSPAPPAWLAYLLVFIVIVLVIAVCIAERRKT